MHLSLFYGMPSFEATLRDGRASQGFSSLWEALCWSFCRAPSLYREKLLYHHGFMCPLGRAGEADAADCPIVYNS